MTDMCVGSLPSARGLFVLYEIQNSYSLKFVGVRTRRGTSFSTNLVVPPGARSLASITNALGYTDLLVGGDGLYHFTSKAASHSHRAGTLLTSDAVFQGLKQLYIAKAEKHISVWVENKDGTIVYQLMNLDASGGISVRTTPIPLLSRHPSMGRFAASLNPDNGSQQFFLIVHNNLVLLEQSGSTRLWQTTLVAVPSIGRNLEFSSYTSHINLTDSNGKPLLGAKVLLSSSGWTDITVNGHVYSVGQRGIPVTTDSLGNLTVILAVNDIASHIFTLTDLPNGRILDGQTYVVNPSKKIIDGLAKIKTGADLRNAKLQNGQPLLSGSKNDIDKAAKVISQLHGVLSRVPSNGTSVCSASTVAGLNATTAQVALAATEYAIWDIWHWIEGAFDKVTRWVVEAAGDVWLFVIDFGGKSLRFLLDNVTHVLKAISWVIKEVLGIDIEKIILWLGFIFAWGDILDTHKMIVQMTNEAISWGADNVASFAGVVDNFFLGIKDTIRGLTLPTSLKDTKVHQPSGGDTSSIHTPGGNWCNYQLEHGGITSVPPSNDVGQTDPFTTLWRDVLKPTLDSLENTASKIGNDLVDIFKTNFDPTVGQVFEKLGSDLLIGFIDALHIISTGLIRLLAKVFRAVKDMINTSIDIPILTPLYKLLSGGSNLTFLDAIALLIAIPSTVTYKIVTGRKLAGIPPWKDIIGSKPSSLASTGTAFDLDPPAFARYAIFLKNYSYFSGIVSPIASFFSTLVSTMKWANPTYGSIKFLEKLDLAIGFCGLVFSYPLSSNPKPGIYYQIGSWGLGCLHQCIKLVLMILGSVVPKAVMDKLSGVAGLVVGVGQLVLQIITTVLETQATVAEFPDKDGTAIILKVANASLTSSGKAMQGFAKIVGPEHPEVSGPAMVFGVGANYISFPLAVVRVVKDISSGRYHWAVDIS